ncbi:hypothetical protein H1R20_g1691, partial [Candolleomyces eurysporus]
MANPNLAADVPKNAGRTFLIGGTAVAGLLLGTFFSMSYLKKREQAAGRNPHHEQLQGALQRPVPNPELSELQPMKGYKAQYSDIPPAFPGHEHHSGHQTLSSLKQELRESAKASASNPTSPSDSAGTQEGAGRSSDGEIVLPGRWAQSTLLAPSEGEFDQTTWQERRKMVPPPQRGKKDDSGRAYTKGPDYVKNYEKTAEGKARVVPARHEMH